MKRTAKTKSKPAKPTSIANKIRQAALAKIHIAQEQLGMDDDTYRELLTSIVSNGDEARLLTAEGKIKWFNGDISAKHLTGTGLNAVIECFKTAGFKGSKQYKGKPHNADSSAANARRLSKVEALLADADRPWSYAIAIAKQMYKKEKLEFCTGEELGGIITALVKDAAKREAVK
jgi:phage gp16-like protein